LKIRFIQTQNNLVGGNRRGIKAALAILATAVMIDPTDAAPLTETELAAVHACLSDVDAFLQRCYNKPELRTNVISAVSLVSGHNYVVPGTDDSGTGEQSYRDLFKKMISEHDHDPDFVKLINFLDSLVLDDIVEYGQLRDIVLGDGNHYLINHPSEKAIPYLLSRLPDASIARLFIRHGASILEMIMGAIGAILEDEEKLSFMRAEIGHSLTPRDSDAGRSPASELGSKLEMSNFSTLAVYFLQAAELGKFNEFTSTIYPIEADKVAGLLASLPDDMQEQFLPLLMVLSHNHPFVNELKNAIDKFQRNTNLMTLVSLLDNVQGVTQFLVSLEISDPEFQRGMAAIQRGNAEARQLVAIYHAVLSAEHAPSGEELRETLAALATMNPELFHNAKQELQFFIQGPPSPVRGGPFRRDSDGILSTDS
jgi:hypothetical protein